MQTKTPPNELPPDVQTLDEAYPAMAIADQVRAYAAEQVAAERKRLRAEYDAAMELLRVTREVRDELAGKLVSAPIAVIEKS